MGADCMDAAAVLRSKGYNPVILNMANAKTPGGGWRNGAGAQEESLFRRTNYLHSLIDPQRLGSKKRYPLAEFGGVYSPGVLSFRANEASGYAFLPAPEPYSFIAAAAINRPRLVQVSRGRKRLEPKSASKTKRKLGAVLSIGLDHGHDAIILSAFGCGAFKNPPEQIAEIFKELLIADPGSAYSSSATAGRQGKGNNTGRGLLQHALRGILLPLQPISASLVCALHRAVDVCAVDVCAVCSHACRLVHRV